VLESNLGVSLLRRTTRRVTLTAQGREYFNQCREPLTLLEEAERVLTRAQKRPEGLLRITVPVILSQEPFFNFMSAFMKDHARIRVELVVTNLLLDLIAENIDVAIASESCKIPTSSPGGSAQAFITSWPLRNT